jgi:hypothetical protein
MEQRMQDNLLCIGLDALNFKNDDLVPIPPYDRELQRQRSKNLQRHG